jgi:hypothetical protein
VRGVARDLADTDDAAAQASLLARAEDERLSDPLALGIADARRDARVNDGLFKRYLAFGLVLIEHVRQTCMD